MPRIRVLIVDDSVVVRRLLSEMLSSDPAVEVAGTAPNGKVGLDKVRQLSPDVVVLDLEMPEMNGLQMLEAVRAEDPRLPVVVFSRYTQRGAVATLEALSRGANDYVSKPDSLDQEPDVLARVREQLLGKIKGFFPSQAAPPPVAARPRRPAQEVPAARVEVVALGVSTGGPKALAELVPALPPDLPVPVLLVQHMPPLFLPLLAQRLSGLSGLSVEEAVDGTVPEAGHVYLAPGDWHLEVARAGLAVLRLTKGPRENSCRPSVDVLFRSAAEAYGSGVLAVVMTGMGQDGLRGSEVVRARGGQVLVQDEPSSVVWGMPGAVCRAGLADAVVPLEELAGEITRRVGRGRG